MDVEEQVTLLSRVDIFESLSREEISDLLDDLLQRNAESELRPGQVFYTPRQPDGKLFIRDVRELAAYPIAQSSR